MKFLLLVFILLIGCKSPSEPIGVKVIDEWHYETVGVCRGIDVSDSVLVAAASANGYFRFDINFDINNTENMPMLELVHHNPDINNTTGDDFAYDAIISTSGVVDMAFVLDDVDGIIVDRFDNDEWGAIGTCESGSIYRSMAINEDNPDEAILFTLQKYFALEDSVGDVWDINSTVISFRSFIGTEFYGDLYLEELDCDSEINLNIAAMKIFYADNLLTVTNGDLGVQIYSFNSAASFEDIALNSLNSFYIQGGEAESLYSIGNYVIGGFNNDRGCYMALLDSEGDIIGNLTFADGYSINAIDYDRNSGTLALAAGNDGIIIYEWNESLSLALKGILNTGSDNYIYDLKVLGNNIFVASENGISIYKIGI